MRSTASSNFDPKAYVRTLLNKHPRMIETDLLRQRLWSEYQATKKSRSFGPSLQRATPFEKLAWVMKSLHHTLPLTHNETFLLKDGYLACHILASKEDARLQQKRKTVRR